MATDHYKLGPGVLSFDPDAGGAGVAVPFEMQMTNTRIDPSENVTEGDDLDLLDGSTLDGEDDVKYTYVLAGTAVQDLNESGFTNFTWENKGLECPFVFTPNIARGAAVGVTGTCRIVPLTVGGDAKKRNTADFSFVCIGEPVFTPDSTP